MPRTAFVRGRLVSPSTAKHRLIVDRLQMRIQGLKLSEVSLDSTSSRGSLLAVHRRESDSFLQRMQMIYQLISTVGLKVRLVGRLIRWWDLFQRNRVAFQHRIPLKLLNALQVNELEFRLVNTCLKS